MDESQARLIAIVKNTIANEMKERAMPTMSDIV